MSQPVVGIDAAPLLGARTGVGVFVHGLVGALSSRGGVALRAYGLTARGWRHLGAELPGTVHYRRLPLPAGAALGAWAHVDVPTIEWWTGRVDVVHGTNFVVPPSRRAARLVTVHDLTSLHFPELCTPTARRYPHLLRRAIGRGAWVHAVSESVAAEVTEHLGAHPDRVTVVYSGVEQPGVPPGGRATNEQQGPPYVLALGTVEPRKDLPGLVAAFDRIAGDVPDLELRIAGPPGWGEDALTEAIAHAAHRRRIFRLGWVEHRKALLAGAAVVAYPSRYEGFGFPPLEAMALGVPVVASTAGALPEVLGDAALLVVPGDTDALAAALARTLHDSGLRRAMVAAGRDRAGRYRWEHTSEQFVDLYGRLARQR